MAWLVSSNASEDREQKKVGLLSEQMSAGRGRGAGRRLRKMCFEHQGKSSSSTKDLEEKSPSKPEEHFFFFFNF